MKITPFGEKIIKCEITFDEIDFIRSEDENIYYKIFDNLVDQIVFVDGVKSFDTMNNIIELDDDMLYDITNEIQSLIRPTVLKHIGEGLDDLMMEYREYKKDPDAWVDDTGDFLEREIEKLNKMRCVYEG